jgi:hypothetical protein
MDDLVRTDITPRHRSGDGPREATAGLGGRTLRFSLDTYALGEAADWMDRQRSPLGSACTKSSTSA